MATSGEIRWPCVGRNRWPLTLNPPPRNRRPYVCLATFFVFCFGARMVRVLLATVLPCWITASLTLSLPYFVNSFLPVELSVTTSVEVCPADTLLEIAPTMTVLCRIFSLALALADALIATIFDPRTVSITSSRTATGHV